MRITNLLTATLLSIVWCGSAVGAGQGRQTASIPPGTEITLRLMDQLDTGESKPGQTFTATVRDPVVVNGKTVLARGARVSGRIDEVVSAGRLKRPASITLELTSLHTNPLHIDGKSHLLRNVELIGGGAAAGALIGGILEGKKGAAVGAAVGAGGGTAAAYMTGKKEIVLPVETALNFVVAGAAGGAATTAAARSGTSGAGRSSRATPEDEETPVFSERDQELVRRYFRTNTANLPPGLAKRGGNLPPGLERHLERNGTLPPGLEKRIQPFPRELDERLPRLPDGYSRVILAGHAMILDRKNKILDLMLVFEAGANQRGHSGHREHEEDQDDED